MKEIIDRLQENRQIELAKSILESNGYKVAKESNIERDQVYVEFLEALSTRGMDELFQDIAATPEDYDESPEFLSAVQEFLGDSKIYLLSHDSVVYEEEIIGDKEYTDFYNDLAKLLGGKEELVSDNDPLSNSGYRSLYKITSPLGNALKTHEYGAIIIYLPDNTCKRLKAKLES